MIANAFVPSRVDGLDILMGGGFRPFARAGGGPSLTVLVRGPAGSGKTLLGAGLALGAARERSASIAYACVELLPEELKAQLAGIALPVDVLFPPLPAKRVAGTSILAGLISFDAADPDNTFVPALGDLVGAVAASVEKLGVLVIDSVSTGYGLVSGKRRELADAVCKLSAMEGLFTVVIEESEGDPGSPWPFSVDVVIELRRGADTQRELWVSKNRSGPAEGGWTRFRIDQGRGVLVMPPASSWYAITPENGRSHCQLRCSPMLDIGSLPPHRRLTDEPSICAVSAEMRLQPSWVASQLLADWQGNVETPGVVVGFGRPENRGGVRYIDGAKAASVEELVTSILACGLEDPVRAPVVRVNDVHLGAYRFGDRLLRELLVGAELLRRHGCQVVLAGWPEELRDAADWFIMETNGVMSARRAGANVARVDVRGSG